MSIYINKNNQQLGPFEEAKVREMLASGQLSPEDLAIRHGGSQWQKLGEMLPSKTVAPAASAVTAAAASSSAAANTAAAVQQSQAVAPKKSRKGLLLGCGGFFLVALLIAGVLGFLAYRNLNPADDSREDLPDTVKDFKLDKRYPPKGNIWGTEKMYMGIYSEPITKKSVIYLMMVYSSESAAKDAMRAELAKSCKSGESPMYFRFVKNGVDTSEGATCAVPLYVQKDNKLVTLGGSGADVETFIEFAENLPFNGGAEMKKK